MQQCQEVRHDALHAVGHEHLVAVELYLVAADLDVALYLWEVEHARQVEREIDVQMYPEQRLVLHRVELGVELLVVLVLELRRLACPQRGHIVDDVVLGGLDLLAVLPLLFLAEGDCDGQERAVLRQQAPHLVLLEVLLAVVGDMQDDVGPPLVAAGILDLEFRVAVARPLDRLAPLAVGAGDDFHLVRHHECRVETQAEVPDDAVGVVLVLLHEVRRPRERYLVDVLVDFLLRHADAVVRDGDCPGILVDGHADGEVAQFALEVAHRRERLQFLCRVDGV